MIAAVRRVSILLAVLALAGCGTMMTSPAPARMTDGVLTNAAGMTLYTFDRDVAGFNNVWRVAR
jgi:predicted lipoprotein with Yx(FWY)xxD motif